MVPHPLTHSTSLIHAKTLSGAPPSLRSSMLLGVWHLELIQEGSLCFSKYKWRPSHPHFLTISWAIVMLPNSCLIPLISHSCFHSSLLYFWEELVAISCYTLLIWLIRKSFGGSWCSWDSHFDLGFDTWLSSKRGNFAFPSINKSPPSLISSPSLDLLLCYHFLPSSLSHLPFCFHSFLLYFLEYLVAISCYNFLIWVIRKSFGGPWCTWDFVLVHMLWRWFCSMCFFIWDLE